MKSSEKVLSAEVNGITISYKDSGTNNTPLIFIHGFHFSKSAWRPQLKALKDSYRVITYDIRGYGRSTAGSEPASMDLFAADLIAFMDALGIEKAIVCGLSMGGYILTKAVALCPERFEAIILNNTRCIANLEETRPHGPNVRRSGTLALKGFAESFIKTIFNKKTLKNKKIMVEEVKNLILATPVRALTTTLQSMAQRRESSTLLKSVSIPALIICGKNAGLIPLSPPGRMANVIHRSIMRAIKEAGQLQSPGPPDELTAHIHNFLPGFLS